MTRNRYGEILISGNSEELARLELNLAQALAAPRQTEGMMEAVFPEPRGDRIFRPSEMRTSFSYYPPGNSWTLSWLGRQEPGEWNGPPPTGRAKYEALSLNIRLPPKVDPGDFDPVGKYPIIDKPGEGAFASYALAHEHAGFVRIIVFPAIKGSITVSRDGENLAGRFEVQIPLSPIEPAPFEPPDTPDYEPPEFLLITRNGMFNFPIPPIP